MKVLITGAAGFIGSHVVEGCLAVGYDVRALVHYNSIGSWGYLKDIRVKSDPRLEVVFGDICDARVVYDASEGVDRILHLAALIGIPYSLRAPESYVRTNIIGTFNVLEAARLHKVRRVIITSTSEVYGSAMVVPINEQHPLQGQTPYSATKIAADKLAEAYHKSFDLPVVVLRPFNTYGPRQSSRAVIPTILSQAISGADKIVLGNLAPKRDFTFVEDTAKAFVLAIDTDGIDGETIHFGSGKAISIGELANRCLASVGRKAAVVSVGDRQRPEKSEVNCLLCDSARAKRLLGWTPTVELDLGLRRVADYVRLNPSLYRAGEYQV